MVGPQITPQLSARFARPDGADLGDQIVTDASLGADAQLSEQPIPSQRDLQYLAEMSELRLAAAQMAMIDADGTDNSIASNVNTAEQLVRRAAADGADIVLLPELFESPYFCKEQSPDHLRRARPLDDHPTIERFAALAAELGVVLPISVYERAGQALFNTVVIIDADGTRLGQYRKSHIPDGPGYTEKYYFSPGDTGFKVWLTSYGTIGVGICWDQWFPEAARSMALLGAEVLLYPTAIGSEPPDPMWDSSGHWQRVMQGHAGANLVPVVAANRVGHEPSRGGATDITFYGSSFIADPTGAIVVEAHRDDNEVIHAVFDREQLASQRLAWGLFRDRRPDLYGALTTLDGGTPAP